MKNNCDKIMACDPDKNDMIFLVKFEQRQGMAILLTVNKNTLCIYVSYPQSCERLTAVVVPVEC